MRKFIEGEQPDELGEEVAEREFFGFGEKNSPVSLLTTELLSGSETSCALFFVAHPKLFENVNHRADTINVALPEYFQSHKQFDGDKKAQIIAQFGAIFPHLVRANQHINDAVAPESEALNTEADARFTISEFVGLLETVAATIEIYLKEPGVREANTQLDMIATDLDNMIVAIRSHIL